MNLLRLDSSSRSVGSHSRALADRLERRWTLADPTLEVRRRDLVADPVPHIHDRTIRGFYAAPDALGAEELAATALSDRLIDELRWADALLLSTPMYNFGPPSALKAWIDLIVRVGRTFEMAEGGLRGTLSTRAVIVTTASGARFSGTPLEAMDFLRPYLRALFGFLGVERVEFLGLEGTTMEPDGVQRELESAEERGAGLLREIAGVA